jgi:hypothetical protein
MISDNAMTAGNLNCARCPGSSSCKRCVGTCQLGVRKLAIDGESVHGHPGVVPGFSGISMHNLEHGFTIVVLGNVSTIGQTNLYAELQSVVMRSG